MGCNLVVFVIEAGINKRESGARYGYTCTYVFGPMSRSMMIVLWMGEKVIDSLQSAPSVIAVDRVETRDTVAFYRWHTLDHWYRTDALYRNISSRQERSRFCGRW